MSFVGAGDLHIEPGVHMLRAPDGSRQQLGKVVINLRMGTIWSFPTGNSDPDSISVTSNEPPVSTPFILGKFSFKSLDR